MDKKLKWAIAIITVLFFGLILLLGLGIAAYFVLSPSQSSTVGLEDATTQTTHVPTTLRARQDTASTLRSSSTTTGGGSSLTLLETTTTRPPASGKECGVLDTPCCNYRCDEGLTCVKQETDEGPDYLCMECGGDDQPCCVPCAGITQTCGDDPNLEKCAEGLRCCAREGGESLCSSCGCTDQECCDGECHKGDDTCWSGYCMSKFCMRLNRECKTDDNCCKNQRCVDYKCTPVCATDEDCTAYDSDPTYVCIGDVCQYKLRWED